MNKNVLIGLIIIVIVGVVGFMMVNNSSQPAQQESNLEEQVEDDETENDEEADEVEEEGEDDQGMTEPDTEPVIITLSEQNASGESGTATLTEENGKVKVALQLTGAPKGVTQPAHIHVGTCPDVGAVKYPLTSPVNGISETILDVSMDQLEDELPLGLNVHKSTTQAQVYVSCGDLDL